MHDRRVVVHRRRSRMNHMRRAIGAVPTEVESVGMHVRPRHPLILVVISILSNGLLTCGLVERGLCAGVYGDTLLCVILRLTVTGRESECHEGKRKKSHCVKELG
jgi:hypothetical protein